MLGQGMITTMVYIESRRLGIKKPGIDNTLQLAMCFHVHFLNSVLLHIL